MPWRSNLRLKVLRKTTTYGGAFGLLKLKVTCHCPLLAIFQFDCSYAKNICNFWKSQKEGKSQTCGSGFECGVMKANASKTNLWPIFRNAFFPFPACMALVVAFFSGAVHLIFKLFPFLLLRVNLNKASAPVAIVPVIFYRFIRGRALIG